MLAGWHPHFIRVIAESIMATHNRQPTVAPAPLFLPLALSLSLSCFLVECLFLRDVQTAPDRPARLVCLPRNEIEINQIKIKGDCHAVETSKLNLCLFLVKRL